MIIENEHNIYTFKELIELYLPNTYYLEDNQEQVQSLSKYLYAYLNIAYNIDIRNNLWYLKIRS